MFSGYSSRVRSRRNGPHSKFSGMIFLTREVRLLLMRFPQVSPDCELCTPYSPARSNEPQGRLPIRGRSSRVPRNSRVLGDSRLPGNRHENYGILDDVDDALEYQVGGPRLRFQISRHGVQRLSIQQRTCVRSGAIILNTEYKAGEMRVTSRLMGGASVTRRYDTRPSGNSSRIRLSGTPFTSEFLGLS
jgi:hypothetical protein